MIYYIYLLFVFDLIVVCFFVFYLYNIYYVTFCNTGRYCLSINFYCLSILPSVTFYNTCNVTVLNFVTLKIYKSLPISIFSFVYFVDSFYSVFKLQSFFHGQTNFARFATCNTIKETNNKII